MSFKGAKRFYMIAIAAAVIVAITVSLAYFFAYAWFAQNNAVSAGGMIATLNADKGMSFTDTVTAVHYKLTGKKIEYTYSVNDDGTLTLKTDNSDYLIESILPGEYIDVKIGFYITDPELKGKSYTVSFNDFAYDKGNTETDNTKRENTFILLGKNLKDGYKNVVFGVLPAFKWSTNPTNDTNGDDTTSDYKFFHGEYSSADDDTTTTIDETKCGFFYYADGSDDSNYSEEITSGTWGEDNLKQSEATTTNFEAVYLTFRIKEDFTEYYKLFDSNVTGADYYNYLSDKIMSMNIRLSTKSTGGTA